ncbi:MAG: spermidine/putrescine transport system ATP-binding protein [Actinomycetota bacterium]|nr:spermidine/putrescine transport system ATP-binding protein [Actinomycetota bacterium]
MLDLRLENVAKGFGDVRAVDGISLEVGRGEFFSLLGPSGCGKTTTLRLVAGFEQPDEGRILIAGEDVTGVPPNKRKVNTVFQHYALFPHLNVEDNVAYGLKQSRTAGAELGSRLDEALRTVRLDELRKRKPRELSGGQQQRVALARALINEPTVLLLDEPLAALDLKLRKAMQQELKKLQERVGITFIYVTHDQEEALTLSDRIAVMNNGRILQLGSPSEIYERPRTRFVADFIGQTNFFEGIVESEQGDVVIVRASDGIELRCARTDFVTPGQNVAVSVRPEKIAPANGSPAPNVLEGTLIRRTYLGDLQQHHVLLNGGRELTVQRQNDPEDPAARWQIGERVKVSWDAASSLLLELDDPFLDEEDLRLIADGSTVTTEKGRDR